MEIKERIKKALIVEIEEYPPGWVEARWKYPDTALLWYKTSWKDPAEAKRWFDLGWSKLAQSH